MDRSFRTSDDATYFTGASPIRGTEITIDLDGIHSPASLLRFVTRNWWFPILFEWPVFGQLYMRKRHAVDVRKTSHSNGYHIRLFVKNKIPPLYLVMVQLSLGSDPKRDCLNFRRIIELKLKVWNILYRDKLTGRGDYTSHEKRPDKRTAKKIADQIKEWNLWKKGDCDHFEIA